MPLAVVLGVVTAWAVAVLASCQDWGKSPMVSGAAGAASPTWCFRQWRVFGLVSSNYSPCFDDRKILSYEGPKPHLVPWWSRMHRPPVRAEYDDGALQYKWWSESGHGWPLSAFGSSKEYDGRYRSRPAGYRQRRSGAVEIELAQRTIVLPYRPIAAGLAVDAGLYGAVWLGLLWGPGAMRRGRRRRRGLCLRCGYEIGGAAVCPECGRQVTNGRQEHRRKHER